MAAGRRPTWGLGRGQAMLEFALTIGLFLSMLLGAISASFYAIERGAAVTGVAAAARVAAGASPSDPNNPYLEGAASAFGKVMDPVRFGSEVRALPAGTACPSLESVPRAQIQICATRSGDLVRVEAVGWPANPISGAFGIAWPLDVTAELRRVTFAG